jgi:DinB superfamily
MSIRPAYSNWPRYNRAIRDVVAGLTAEQLALQPTPERWPIWATIGHLACQRVFWLCDFAGEAGADSSPFPNAGNDCPGDDDLEHVWSADALAAALDSTFHVVDGRLDRWTLDMLEEEIRAPWGDGRAYSRGSIPQRVFAHDISHAAELNEVLGREGLPQVNFWD